MEKLSDTFDELRSGKVSPVFKTPGYEPGQRLLCIARTTLRIFDVPAVVLSVGDNQESADQWVYTAMDLSDSQRSALLALCMEVAVPDETYVIANLHKDPDFRRNALVAGYPSFRFIASQPLDSGDQSIGTLCAIATTPRHFRPVEYRQLRSIGQWLTAELQALQCSGGSLVNKLLNSNPEKKLVNLRTAVLNEDGFELLEGCLAHWPEQASHA